MQRLFASLLAAGICITLLTLPVVAQTPQTQQDETAQIEQLIQQATQQAQQGKLLESIKTFEQLLAIARQRKYKELEALAFLGLGFSYDNIGRPQQALDNYSKALLVYRETKERSGEGTTLNNIGAVYDSLGKYEQALDYYGQALAITKEVGDRAGEGTTLNNIGYVYKSLGKYEQALDYYQQALAIRKEVGDRRHEGTTLNNIGAVYDSLGKYEQALDYYGQALAITKEVGDREGESAILNNIGYVLEAQKQSELAIIFYKESVNITEAMRNDIKGLPKDLQQSYLETVAKTYRRLADLLLQQDRILEAQQVLDLLKVQELDDYLRGVRGTGQQLAIFRPEEEILKKYNELQKSAIEIGKELAQLKEAKIKGQLTPAQEQRYKQLNALEIELRKQINAFFSEPEIDALVKQLKNASNESINPEQFTKLRDQLKTLNAALLYPLILDAAEGTRSARIELVIVVPNSPPLRRTVTVKKADLNSTIVAFRQALESPTSDAKTPANKLYKWLIEPIKADLEQAGIKTIIYLPDGQLRYIPLAALYDGKQWLVEHYRVNNITATSLTDLDSEPSNEPRILVGAFADESLNYPIPVGKQTVNFKGLPFAGKELENLAALTPIAVKLLDKDFNLATLELEMGIHTILHFATHAAFVPGAPENSFILLGSGEHPNLKDISNWSLQDVDLVVLSACETGLGGNFGDGREILGLGYQFQLAGAKAVIASLWQVNDEGTQALMTAFYGALQQDGITKSEALRQAQIALITGNYEVLGGNRGIVVRERLQANVSSQVRGQLSHPYYWAPFILIGNGL